MNTADRDVGLPPLYVGQSHLLHYWPWGMVAIALIPLALGQPGVFVLLVVPALIFGAILPWRFAVTGQGIRMWFGFGKRRFVTKEDVTVRAGPDGVLVLPHGAFRFGYPLADGLLDGDDTALRSVLVEHGFELVD